MSDDWQVVEEAASQCVNPDATEAIARLREREAQLERDYQFQKTSGDRLQELAEAAEARVAELQEQFDGKQQTVFDLTEYLRREKARVARLEEALREIAGPTPTSHRRTVDQLTDAVKWRRGMARDALAHEEEK